MVTGRESSPFWPPNSILIEVSVYSLVQNSGLPTSGLKKGHQRGPITVFLSMWSEKTCIRIMWGGLLKTPMLGLHPNLGVRLGNLHYDQLSSWFLCEIAVPNKATPKMEESYKRHSGEFPLENNGGSQRESYTPHFANLAASSQVSRSKQICSKSQEWSRSFRTVSQHFLALFPSWPEHHTYTANMSKASGLKLSICCKKNEVSKPASLKWDGTKWDGAS